LLLGLHIWAENFNKIHGKIREYHIYFVVIIQIFNYFPLRYKINMKINGNELNRKLTIVPS